MDNRCPLGKGSLLRANINHKHMWIVFLADRTDLTLRDIADDADTASHHAIACYRAHFRTSIPFFEWLKQFGYLCMLSNHVNVMRYELDILRTFHGALLSHGLEYLIIP